MITAFLGLEKNGIYSQIIFLTSALMIPYRSLLRIGSAFVPYYWKDRDMGKMQILYQKISSVSLLIGLLMFSFIWINIKELFSFLPKEYYDGIWVFLFIMIGRLIDMYFGINGTIFITSKKYKYDIMFTLILILLVVLLNFILIPKYGIIGSSIATSIGYIIYNFGRLVFVYLKYNLHPFNLKQFYLIVIFLFSILVGELIFPLSDSTFLNICIHSIYIILTLCLPIYMFKLEPNTIEYIKNGLQFIRKKAINSKTIQ
jgi:O-antigen/teichoic acid export membrane protein